MFPIEQYRAQCLRVEVQSPVQPGQPKNRIKSFPLLVRKEMLAALLAFAVLGIVSALWDAPLSVPADPSGIPEQDVKAPWIFVGIQQMLRYFPPFVAGILLPLAATAALAAIPYLLPRQPLLISIIFGATVILLTALTLWGYFS
ncbi:hypothetical protein Desti_3673 [Desulfomonile tiedjei DSM 6799]|uniref:Cytochrome b/b6 C-terminal region profile domain-containing protein n=1 Tax=Desulfomonile tiedjei (strain ATCC 49306 / DSM 6799 / DCB-1) TaxID=706587 RepID=I4C9S8_DESTA|nr:hypothetical protein Desti_3673 [Desulfomonile tiedjei DSM 6799]